MGRRDDHLARIAVKAGQLVVAVIGCHPHPPLQGVHDGVAGDHDRRFRNAFADEVRRVAGCRGEVQRGDLCDQPTVGLLRERCRGVTAAQTGLDVDDRHLRLEAGDRAGKRRGGVAVHQYGIDVGERIGLLDACKDAMGDATQGLPRRHHTEFDVRADPELGQGLGQHFAVLTGRDDDRLEPGVVVQTPDEWRHLDSLRARPEDQGKSLAGHVSPVVDGRIRDSGGNAVVLDGEPHAIGLRAVLVPGVVECRAVGARTERDGVGRAGRHGLVLIK